jgi:hypothetical protein
MPGQDVSDAVPARDFSARDGRRTLHAGTAARAYWQRRSSVRALKGSELKPGIQHAGAPSLYVA